MSRIAPVCLAPLAGGSGPRADADGLIVSSRMILKEPFIIGWTITP